MDGRTHYLRVSGNPFFDHQGEFLGYRGTGTDITSEQQLRSAETRLAAAIDHLSESVHLFDANDRLVMSNRVGHDVDDGLAEFRKPGTKYEDYLHAAIAAGEFPDAVGREEEFFRQRMAQHRDPRGPFEVERANGRTLSISAKRLPDGGLLQMATDVTELKAAERRLRESEAKLKESQRIGNLGSWHRDLGSGKLWWSDNMYALLGVTPGAFDDSYTDFMRFVHPDDRQRFETCVEKAIADDQDYEIEYRIVSPDGTEREVYSIGEVVSDEAGNVIATRGIVRDLTERKRTEKQLLASQRNLRALANKLLLVEEQDR